MSGLLPYDRRRAHGIFKSGGLLISAKGLGWKSWKRRWFVLTRTSLIFFKSEPRGQLDPSLALGGIDLNNSGSVHARLEKKLLTVLFPDGRAFTLKAETSEDLEDWRQALERALAVAPSPQLLGGAEGLYRNDSFEISDYSGEAKQRRSAKSLVIGRPILLALEDIDGSPSFLEKALCFIEKQGASVEGILRQSADIELVQRRVREYEEGRNTFGPDEDAHIIGDCIKYVLRELPSSPVPAPCCTALLEALGKENRELKVEAMRQAVADTFPEPNRRLLHRVLRMMKAVAAQSETNRMSSDAVARCMAPLLLRPVLSGECALDDDRSDISGDSMLAAAQAANQANALVLFLMQEYDSVFLEKEQPFRLREQAFAESVPGGAEAFASGELGRADGSEVSFTEQFSGSVDFQVTDLSGGMFTPRSSSFGAKTPPRFDKYSSPLPPRSYVNGSSLPASEASKSSPLCEGQPAAEEEPAAFWNTDFDQPAALTGNGDNTEGHLYNDLRKLEFQREELRTNLNKEAKANAVLRASWERKRQSLKERRTALSSDVLRLQEQLASERTSRTHLESAMGQAAAMLTQPGVLEPDSRAQLAEVAKIEECITKLREQVRELLAQLVAQQEESPRVTGGRKQRAEALTAVRMQLEVNLSQLAKLAHEERLSSPQPVSPGAPPKSPEALEVDLAQKRLAVAEAQAALRAQLARTQEIRTRQQVVVTAHDPVREAGGPRTVPLKLHKLDVNMTEDGPASPALTNGSSNAEAWEARSPDPSSPALSELNSKLEHFKERRSRLMQQLSALSEPITPSTRLPSDGSHPRYPPISPSP